MRNNFAFPISRVFFIYLIGRNFVGRNFRRAKFSSGEIFVGRNFRRAKFSSGEFIRRAKFWSLCEKFITFARRKIRNLSYFMRTQYNLYISAPSKNYSSGEIFVGRNFRRAKLFVGRNYSSGEIIRRAKLFVGRNYSSGEIIRRAKLFVGRNYSSGEIFVGRNFRHLAKNSSLSPDKVSGNKVDITRCALQIFRGEAGYSEHQFYSAYKLDCYDIC